MTTLFCVNPASRSGTAVDCEPLVKRLEELGPVVFHPLGEKALEPVIAELGDRLARIVIGGGDGTLNRALPAVIEAAVPLGVLPLGTGNDFARTLSLPLDPDAALDAVLEGETRRVDLGEANGHWFLNAAGIGLGPELTKKLDHEKKRRLGVLAYLSSLIEVFGERRRRRAILEINGIRKRTPFMQITIANGIHYGGGLTIAQDADVDDGKLRVLVLKPQTPFALIAKFAHLRWGASASNTDGTLQLYRADTLRIVTRYRCDVTLDGELITETPVVCRCVPDALTVYAPSEAGGSPGSEAALKTTTAAPPQG